MELAVDKALREAIRAFSEGKISEAERLYKAILKSQPMHPDANHNLGVLYVSQNKAEASLLMFKNALKASPKIEQFWISYISILIQQEQYEKAETALKEGEQEGLSKERIKLLTQQLRSKENQEVPRPEDRDRLLKYYQDGFYDDAEILAVSITQKFPNYQLSWKILGGILKKSGRLSEALVVSEKVVELSPEDAEAHSNMGVILEDLGRLEEATSSFRKAIELKFDYVQAYFNLGNTLVKLGRIKDAETSYKKAVSYKPDYVDAYHKLGNTSKELGRLKDAEKNYKKAIDLEPAYAEAHSNLGNVLKDFGRLSEAENSYRKAIDLESEFAEPYNNLGILFEELGRLKEAKANYKKAIELKSNFAEAHHNLSQIKKFQVEDKQFIQMLELHRGKELNDEQRCHINFALGKAYEDLNKIDASFKCYVEGNSLRKKALGYNIRQDIKLFDQLKHAHPDLEKKSLKNLKSLNSPRIIFILGMPRSGTTLIEQIISAHSEVMGGGELPYLEWLGDSVARGLPVGENVGLRMFRQSYLEKVQKLYTGSLIITDKTPLNFRYIGLILASLPDAKIVHVKRNAAATCWGNYKQYFATKNLGYCYDLDDLTTYYELYVDLMRFWNERYGERIYNLSYETLIQNQKAEIRELINYLDLGWEAACLAPENNRRRVTTASKGQVRRKIYQGSFKDWRKFEPFLNGLFDYLDESIAENEH